MRPERTKESSAWKTVCGKLQLHVYKSCRTARRKNSSVIEDTAAKLGLTGRVGWEGKLYHEDEFRQFYHETAGSIWGMKGQKVKKL
ncbi:hypothetical protein PO124_20630 [Bacillus licheniformis]|nr:hypothetical protein [Bacillus licheniformis]